MAAIVADTAAPANRDQDQQQIPAPLVPPQPGIISGEIPPQVEATQAQELQRDSPHATASQPPVPPSLDVPPQPAPHRRRHSNPVFSAVSSGLTELRQQADRLLASDGLQWQQQQNGGAAKGNSSGSGEPPPLTDVTPVRPTLEELRCCPRPPVVLVHGLLGFGPGEMLTPKGRLHYWETAVDRETNFYGLLYMRNRNFASSGGGFEPPPGWHWHRDWRVSDGLVPLISQVAPFDVHLPRLLASSCSTAGADDAIRPGVWYTESAAAVARSASRYWDHCDVICARGLLWEGILDRIPVISDGAQALFSLGKRLGGVAKERSSFSRVSKAEQRRFYEFVYARLSSLP